MSDTPIVDALTLVERLREVNSPLPDEAAARIEALVTECERLRSVAIIATGTYAPTPPPAVREVTAEEDRMLRSALFASVKRVPPPAVAPEAVTIARCPFCGSFNIRIDTVRDGSHMCCVSCFANGPTKFNPGSRDAALTAWNRRAAPPAAEPTELTFAAFREANVRRCLKWHPAGIESWSTSDWLTAITGELGELASLVKMRNRERDGLPGNKFSPSQKQIADEIADVLTYLDLFAAVVGVDLGTAAAAKFNEVSERVGFPDRIDCAALRATKGAG